MRVRFRDRMSLLIEQDQPFLIASAPAAETSAPRPAGTNSVRPAPGRSDPDGESADKDILCNLGGNRRSPLIDKANRNTAGWCAR